MANGPEIKDEGVKLTAALVDKMKEQSDLLLSNFNAFSGILTKIATSSDDIPAKLARGDRLMTAMVKDAKLFEKVQKRTFEHLNKNLQKAIKMEKEEQRLIEAHRLIAQKGQISEQEKLEILEKTVLTMKEEKSIEDQITEKHDEFTKLVQGEFDVMKDMTAEIQKQSGEFLNVNDAVNKLADSIRNPSKISEGMLASLGAFPKNLIKARGETKSLGGAFKKMAGDSALGGVVKSLMATAPEVALIAIAVAALVVPLIIMYKLFTNYWEFLDKKVIPAQADFNKEIGNTGAAANKLKAQTVSMGVQFELLGLSFEEGTRLVRDFASGMKSVKPFDKQTMKAAENLVGVLGMGGKEAGRFSLQISKQTGNLDALKGMWNSAAKEANAYQIPQNEIMRDVASSPDIFARFGVASSRALIESTARAHSFGLSIKEVDSAFGNQMDTFEGTSDAAAKLNTIFGTNINSMKLMMEQDPEKRMEIVRKQLVAQGKDWKHLNVFEKDMLATTLHMNKSQLQLALSSEKERKKLEAKAAARKRDQRTTDDWNRSLTKVKRTLIAWGPILDKVTRSVALFVGAFLGFDTSDVKSLARDVQIYMLGISKSFDNATKKIDKIRNSLRLFIKLASLIPGIGGAFSSLDQALSLNDIGRLKKEKSMSSGTSTFQNILSQGSKNKAGGLKIKGFLDAVEKNIKEGKFSKDELKNLSVAMQKNSSELTKMLLKSNSSLSVINANDLLINLAKIVNQNAPKTQKADFEKKKEEDKSSIIDTIKSAMFAVLPGGTAMKGISIYLDSKQIAFQLASKAQQG